MWEILSWWVAVNEVNIWGLPPQGNSLSLIWTTLELLKASWQSFGQLSTVKCAWTRWETLCRWTLGCYWMLLNGHWVLLTGQCPQCTILHPVVTFSWDVHPGGLLPIAQCILLTRQYLALAQWSNFQQCCFESVSVQWTLSTQQWPVQTSSNSPSQTHFSMGVPQRSSSGNNLWRNKYIWRYCLRLSWSRWQ